MTILWECPNCGFRMHPEHAASPIDCPDEDECPNCDLEEAMDELDKCVTFLRGIEEYLEGKKRLSKKRSATHET